MPKTTSYSNQVHYHPFFFLLMALLAVTQLGLAGFLINVDNEDDSWTNSRFRSVLIFTEFTAAWTTLFSSAYVLWIIDGAVHILASIASSILWLLLTTIFWAAAAGSMHHTRVGGNCAGTPALSRCRQTLTVEAIGWTELGLSLITLIATCIWVRTSRRSYRNSFYGQDFGESSLPL